MLSLSVFRSPDAKPLTQFCWTCSVEPRAEKSHTVAQGDMVAGGRSAERGHEGPFPSLSDDVLRHQSCGVIVVCLSSNSTLIAVSWFCSSTTSFQTPGWA